MRSAPTPAENGLWYFLRAKRLQGIKWRRQHPIPPYVVDFYCHPARLVVELDGGQHDVERDRRRTRFLEAQGIRVLRFWNTEWLQQGQGVLEEIWRVVQERIDSSVDTLSPNPSPGGRGEDAW